MTRRAQLAVGVSAVVAVVAIAAVGTLAGASEGADRGSGSELLHGQELIDELGLPEIPYEGTNEDLDCNWATEFGDKAYCLDPAAKDRPSAKLVAAQIRGEAITAELEAGMEALTAMREVEYAISQAEIEGASEEEQAELFEAYETARANYEAAMDALGSSSG
ncbi:MAG: hypothetical protein ACRDHI_11190 [Actinomycetota bacterium]